MVRCEEEVQDGHEGQRHEQHDDQRQPPQAFEHVATGIWPPFDACYQFRTVALGRTAVASPARCETKSVEHGLGCGQRGHAIERT